MTLSRLVFSLAVLLPLSVTAAEPERKQNRPQFAPDKTVPYRTVTDKQGKPDDLDLHLFLPPGHQVSDKRPCVIFFFGGGWNGGSPSQFFPHCEYFASRGLVAISAQYRTKSSHGVIPKVCVFDGKAAVRFLKANANRFGIDPDRIIAGGGSAGGHVAAAVATCDELEEEGNSTEISPVPAALMLFNPVYDNGPNGYGHSRVKAYWKTFSPMHNIDQATPPTIAFFGTEDPLIPVATTEAYAARMKDAGVRYENRLYEGQGHGFFNYGRGRGDTDYFVETVREADRFLISLGFLEGKPTVEDFVKAD